MGKVSQNGRQEIKDDTGPAEFYRAQANGQPWANLNDAHDATAYRRNGDKRNVAAANALGYVVYEYVGLTAFANSNISSLVLSVGYSVDSSFNRPDLISQGQGTENLPYTSSDNTAGLQTIINAMSRGTIMRLIVGAYQTSVSVNMSKHSLNIIGDSAGFNTDPNGESEGINGTKLKATSASIFKVDNSSRRGGLMLAQMYWWGNGLTDGNAGLLLVSDVDQMRIRDINASNIQYGIRATTGTFDTCYISNFNVLNSGYGIKIEAGTSYFMHIYKGCLADLDHAGIILAGGGHMYATIEDMTLVRCSREVDGGNNDYTCAVYLEGRGHKVINCNITETSRRSLAGTWTTAGNGIVVKSHDTLIANNEIAGNTKGTGIVILGKNCRISNNIFSGRAIAGDQGSAPYTNTAMAFSTNMIDILVTNSAQDTIIEQDGNCNIVDQGERTIINGLSKNAGDPNTQSSWAAIAVKPEGLKIYDTVNDTTWLYGSLFPNGRIAIQGTGTTTPPPTATDITFDPATANNFIEDPSGSKTYKVNGVTNNDWGQYAVSQLSLPANTEGRIWAKAVNAAGGVGSNFSLIFSENNTPAGWQTATAAFAFVCNSSGDVYQVRNGSVNQITGTSSGTNTYFSLYRLANGQVKVQISSDQTNWTTVFTFTDTSTAQLYIKADLLGTDNTSNAQRGILYQPKGTGIV